MQNQPTFNNRHPSGFNQFPDFEIEHSGIRLLVALPLFSWLVIQTYLSHTGSELSPPLILATVYVVFAATMLLFILNDPHPSSSRRIAGIIADVAFLSCLTFFSGKNGLFLLFLYPLLISSNGFRFGASYLYFTLSATILGLGIVLIASTFWSQHLMQGIGALAGIIGVSLYLASIIKAVGSDNWDPLDSTEVTTKEALPETPQDTGIESAQDTADLAFPSTESTSEAESGVYSDYRKVLLLSRNPTNAERISTYLKDWNHAFETSQNSMQAFNRLMVNADTQGIQPFDILLVDHRQLELDPLQIAAAISEEPTLASTSLFFLGPKQPEQYRQQLLQAGYSQILETPLNKSILFAALRANPEIQDSEKSVVSLISRLNLKASSLPPQEILVAENNPVDRNSIERALKQEGHRVYAVENGEQALDALESHHFDLAIVNLSMPVMSGIQVIKLHHFTHSMRRWMPFVVITDENSPTTIRECESAEADACIFKPIQQNELVKTVTAVISSDQEKTREKATATLEEGVTTRFHNADTLDVSVLKNLEILGNDPQFISNLITTFTLDSERTLQQMDQALADNDSELFKDLAHLFVDSAGHLGAFALYEYSLSASRILPSEFDAHGANILQEMRTTFTRTSDALMRFLSQDDETSSYLS
ncbi:MAG: response regulator [gamma proteobacterium endosymbiont of Lamellibrachia anaximandri]|nr:response regulator [gamma proteobacterium endosymbiont of Lamellibrachia anaximandri]